MKDNGSPRGSQRRGAPMHCASTAEPIAPAAAVTLAPMAP
jgi:hypothetical protein